MQNMSWRELFVIIATGFLALSSAFVPYGAVAQQKLLEPRQPATLQLPGSMSVNAWCGKHRRGAASGEGEANQARLRLVQAELAPGFDTGTRRDGLDLLSAYQAELEAYRPDPASAATYLALTSTVPITLGTVERVNHLLCVCSSRAFAETVAAMAESERQQMAN